MHLYLVRHPHPLVAPDICYGSTDLAVEPQECARVAAELLPALPKGARLFSSPLRRCADLAASVVDALGSGPVNFDARLAEMHFGDWERRAWNEIPRVEIDAWASDPAGYRPGGGEGVLRMAQRVRAFHDEVLLLQQDCVVICHAGTIRLLSACRLGLPPAEMARHTALSRHKIAYGDVIVLDC